MAADEGSQKVTIRFHRPVDSDIVNRRFKGIRPVGIHSGGYLTKTGGDNVSLSTLICEISDGTHQVRVETTATVTKTLSEAAPYLVLNWAYTGVENTDYMVIETSGSPDANDVVVGKGIFVASALSTISYSERTTPGTHYLFLRVEETETPSTSVRVRAGVGHAGSAHAAIIDQIIDLSGYSLNDVIYIYVNDTGGVTHSATAATYAGKALLAKIVYPAGAIDNDDIEDVRSFVVSPTIPDESTITRTSTGKLEVKDLGITNAEINSNVVDGTTIEKDGSTGKLAVKTPVVIGSGTKTLSTWNLVSGDLRRAGATVVPADVGLAAFPASYLVLLQSDFAPSVAHGTFGQGVSGFVVDGQTTSQFFIRCYSTFVWGLSYRGMTKATEPTGTNTATVKFAIIDLT